MGRHVDLRGNGGGLAVDAIEQVAGDVHAAFVDLVERLSQGRDDDLDWWVTSLASRNTYACPLYENLCRLILARSLIDGGCVDGIVVDSPALAAAVRRMALSGVDVSFAGTPRWRRIVGAFKRYAGAIFHTCSQWAFSRAWRRRPLPDVPVVLVDTFFYDDSVRAGRLVDRHYPGLLDGLDEVERRQVRFMPTHYRIRNYWRHFRDLADVAGAVLLKEQVLTATDYLYALAHPLRLRWPRGSIDFLGIEVGGLVREALWDSWASSASTEGLLRYRTAARLAERGVKLKRVVEWFENQEIDHGANAGWKRFFPGVPVIGYQGFLAADHYVCMFPTALEQAVGMLPDRIAVIGDCLAGSIARYCPGLPVDTAPALRFQSVWSARQCEPDPAWFTIFLALPILPRDATRVLVLSREAVARLDAPKHVRVQVKVHPAWTATQVRALAESLPRSFSLVDKPFHDLLDQANLLVGNASSTCAHAVARGVPVAVAAAPGTLVQNPIPEFVDHALWRICYSSDTLAAFTEECAAGGADAMRRLWILGDEVRERLFSPVTPEGIRHLLGLSDG